MHMNTWFGIFAAYPRGGRPGANLCLPLEGMSRGGQAMGYRNIYIEKLVRIRANKTLVVFRHIMSLTIIHLFHRNEGCQVGGKSEDCASYAMDALMDCAKRIATFDGDED